MNWESIGALGEVVGALAVVLSLVYVARQIHHGTAAVVAANHENMLSSLRSARHAIAFDAEFADLVIRGESASEELSFTESRRFDEFAISQFEVWEQAFFNHSRSTLDDEAWTGWDAFGREKLVTPGHRAVWNRRRMEFYEPFRQYVDREVFAGPGA